MAKKNAAVEGAIEVLRRYWDLGLAAKDSVGMSGTPGEKQIARMAKAEGINEDTLRKCRQFAASYSKNDLNTLESQCREHQRPLGFSFIAKLATVKMPSRLKLQEQLIKEGWSLARLQLELLKRFGYRKDGGRRPAWPARSVPLMNVEITQMCRSWQRWYEWLAGEFVDRRLKAAGKKREAVELTDLPPEVQDKLKKAMAGIEALRSAVDPKWKEDAGGRKPRRRSRRGHAASGQ